jgi:hypothetical protein
MKDSPALDNRYIIMEKAGPMTILIAQYIAAETNS